MVFIGTSTALDTPAADFFKHDRKVKTVSIIGGGSVGFMLAEKLERTGIKVKLIEQSLQRCAFLADSLKNPGSPRQRHRPGTPGE
jgi:trk system potassium uptake protein TrkA